MPRPILEGQMAMMDHFLTHGRFRGDRQKIWSWMYLMDAVSYAETGSSCSELRWKALPGGPQPEFAGALPYLSGRLLTIADLPSFLSEFQAEWLKFLTDTVTDADLQPERLPGFIRTPIGGEILAAGAFDQTPCGQNHLVMALENETIHRAWDSAWDSFDSLNAMEA